LKSDEIVIVACLHYAVTIATSTIRVAWRVEAGMIDGGGVGKFENEYAPKNSMAACRDCRGMR